MHLVHSTLSAGCMNQYDVYLPDYQSVSFTRNLVAIENPACVENFSISTVDDSLVEVDEQFTISLTSTSFIVSTTNATIQITILIDDCKNSFIARESHVL